MACTNHPLITANVAPCTRCSLPFCEDCLVEMEGSPVCASCKAAAMALAEPVPPPRRPGVPNESVPPWEKRAVLGWWGAFWKTVKEVMSDPVGFFGGMDKSVESYDALYLYPIIATVNAAVMLVLQMAGVGALFAFLPQAAGGGAGGPGGGQGLGQMLAVQLGMQGAFGCLGVIATPFFALLELVLFAGSIHVALVVMKVNTRPFTQTLRGCAYAYCPYVLGIVPLLGGLVGFFWMLVAQVVMTREVHGTTTGKALIAVLWLSVFCCCTIGGVAAVATAIIAANQ